MKFAIKIGTTKQDKQLANAIKKLSDHFPTLAVEGLNRKMRKDKIKGATIINICQNIYAADIEIEKAEYLTFGVSKKYDISFETEEALPKLFGVIPTVPVYNIKKDYNKVINLLGQFMIERYPLESIVNVLNGWKKPQPTHRVVKYSTYVEVNGVPVSYLEYNNSVQAPSKMSSLDALLLALFV